MTTTHTPADQAPQNSPIEGDSDPTGWTSEDASYLYGFSGWGGGFFGVNSAGHAVVTPLGTDADSSDGAGNEAGSSIDLVELAEGLAERGLHTPVLVRFTDVLESRMRDLRMAFDRAISEESYDGSYACVYPIKVNQQRQFVEHLRDVAGPLGFGLEAGSKPELMAVLALTEGLNDDANGEGGMPIICNGFKDDEYLETVILASKLGRNITPVIESFSELGLLLKHAKAYGVRPRIGIRVKPSMTGAGRWAESGGERSKFGLHAPELLAAMEVLEDAGMADCLRLVHFHVGSQICDIQQVKNTVNELARIYCELRRLGATGLDTLDIGGGLGIDYDGSNSTWASSVNYSLDEYARDVVYRVKTACDDEKQPHPRIVSESGRALSAHSSVLIFDVVGRQSFKRDPDEAWIAKTIEREEAAGLEVPQPIDDLRLAWELIRGIDSIEDKRALDAYHDALQSREESRTLFNLGYLSLPLRAVSDRLYWAIGRKVLSLIEGLDDAEVPDQFAGLAEQLSDICFCNFSLFQSLPDSWAIEQIFPIAPIQRLDEVPTRRAILADITCDSDGQISRFGCIDQRDSKPTLEIHEFDINPDGSAAEPYRLAIFLVGAYQEVLGDLHNLFGDTHAVHVSLDDEAGWSIDEVVEGDTVREVLEYVQYDADAMRKSMRREAERAVRKGAMTVAESRNLLRFYEQGLEGYTYLEE